MEKYRDLMEGIASLNFLAGFCYTQLTDIEQERNGLLTYDRRTKIDPERIAEIHREMFRQKPHAENSGEISSQIQGANKL